MARSDDTEIKGFTGANFREVTDLVKDFEEGRKVFECDADEVGDLRMYVHKAYDPAVPGLNDHLTVQWKAHSRYYRAEFRLGLICDVRAAVIGHAGGVVQVAVPVLPGCVPERLQVDVK